MNPLDASHAVLRCLTDCSVRAVGHWQCPCSWRPASWLRKKPPPSPRQGQQSHRPPWLAPSRVLLTMAPRLRTRRLKGPRTCASSWVAASGMLFHRQGRQGPRLGDMFTGPSHSSSMDGCGYFARRPWGSTLRLPQESAARRWMTATIVRCWATVWGYRWHGTSTQARSSTPGSVQGLATRQSSLRRGARRKASQAVATSSTWTFPTIERSPPRPNS